MRPVASRATPVMPLSTTASGSLRRSPETSSFSTSSTSSSALSTCRASSTSKINRTWPSRVSAVRLSSPVSTFQLPGMSTFTFAGSWG